MQYKFPLKCGNQITGYIALAVPVIFQRCHDYLKMEVKSFLKLL